MKITQLVRQIAAQCATKDPYAICQALGIHVVRHPLHGQRGYYMQCAGVDIITLSTALHGKTARFVCAHELGHYFLHQRLNRTFMDARTHMETGRFENEADKFAAQLLFGDPPLYQEPITTWEMADILGVPACNVDARLIELEIYH